MTDSPQEKKYKGPQMARLKHAGRRTVGRVNHPQVPWSLRATLWRLNQLAQLITIALNKIGSRGRGTGKTTK